MSKMGGKNKRQRDQSKYSDYQLTLVFHKISYLKLGKLVAYLGL
jgi:hypothetical protein